jgi:hypothetical protein
MARLCPLFCDEIRVSQSLDLSCKFNASLFSHSLCLAVLKLVERGYLKLDHLDGVVV